MAQFPPCSLQHDSGTVSWALRFTRGSLGRGSNVVEPQPSQQHLIVISYVWFLSPHEHEQMLRLFLAWAALRLFHNLAAPWNPLTWHYKAYTALHSASKACHTDYTVSRQSASEAVLLHLCILPQAFLGLIPQGDTHKSYGMFMFS